MPRPTTRPSWLGTRRAPTPAQRAFVPNQTPPAEWLNWIFGTASDWIDYLDDWIQTTGQPYADELERTLEMQSLYPWRDVATSQVSMTITAVAAQTNAAGALVAVVAVGAGGIIMRYDAVRCETTHPTAAASFTGTWNDVIYAGGQFIAIGSSSTVQTSPDGITWTARSFTAGYGLVSIAYSGTQFLIVGISGSAGQSFTSSDGITWSTAVPMSANLPARVIWVASLSKFFAFCQNFVRTTPSGTTNWATAYSGLGSSKVYDAVWSNGFGFAVISTPSSPVGQLMLARSTDGVTWNSVNSSANWIAAGTQICLLPHNKQCSMLWSASATTYAMHAIAMASLTAAPQPNVSPRVLPYLYSGSIRRVIVAQSIWIATAQLSATQSRIFVGAPVETMRGITT